jgi:hypothetical protein
VGPGVEVHDVLGHLAPLHGCHGRQRQLPGQVPGRVDVRHARLAVVVDGHVSAPVHLHAGGVEPEPLRVGDRPDAQQGVRPRHPPTVVAAHDNATVHVVDALGPGPLQQVDPPPEEVLLEGGRHLRVLGGQHLLAAHDERHLRPEGREQVDELHPRHARTHHHDVLRQLRRRVGVAGRQHPLAVGLGPLGDAGPAPRRQQHGVGRQLGDPLRGVDHDLVGALHPGRPVQQAHALAGQQVPHRRLQVVLDVEVALAQHLQVRRRPDGVDPHALDAPGERHGPAAGDHRLGRDAVPEMGRPADHVLLDQRDLGAEAGGVRGGRVARRAAPDDHEAHRHLARVPTAGWP